MAMYAQDFDDVLVTKENWPDKVAPYIRRKEMLTSPHNPSAPVGFAFNAALSGVKVSSIGTPAQVVSLFETTLTNSAPSDTGESWWVPTKGAVNATGYADGHAKGLMVKPAAEAFRPN